MKSCLTGLVCLILLLHAESAPAQKQGDIVVLTGLAHIRPDESSSTVRTRVRPGLATVLTGDSFDSPGTSLSVSNSSTLAMVAKLFLTDHLAVALDGGIPVKFDISGQGMVAPPGLTGELLSVDLGDPDDNPIGEARQWSPVFMLQYNFGEPDATFRPYIGLGATYTFFTDVGLSDGVRSDIRDNFGTPLALAAGKPGPTSVSPEATSDFAPVYSLGGSYKLGDRWSLSMAATHLGLESDSIIRVRADDGTELAESRSELDLGTFVFSLLVGYNFQ